MRLGNSPNLSESWFHHLYTRLVGINVSLQNRAQPTSSPSPMTSHIPHSKSQSQHEVHQPCTVCPCLDITPTYSKCSRLGAGPWSSRCLKCSSRHRCNSLSGFFQQTLGYIYICSFVSFLSWRMKHCLIHGSIASGYKCLARGGGGGGGG